MNDTLTQNQDFFSEEQKPKKKGCGCLGILSGLVLAVIALIVALWILFMHTSFPLKYVVIFAENLGKEANLKISKPSGSLSSGISCKTITWNDGEITDMRFRYSGIMDVLNDEKLIIHEMHIGSARIFINSNKDSLAETPATDSTISEDPATTGSTAGSTGKPALQLFQIDRLQLNKIYIENRTTGKTIEIPKIEWTGFKAAHGAEVQFGNLIADSDHLVIKTSTPAGSIYQKRFEVTVLPKLDERILKPIKVDAYVGEVNSETIYEINALEGGIVLTTDPSGNQQFTAKDANFAEYFDAPLPNKLNFGATKSKSANDETTDTLSSGTFMLGNKTFEIQPATFTLARDSSENPNLTAIHRGGETEIRYEVPMKQKDFKPKLTSTPAMSPENLLALIYHDQEFSKLSAPDQEKIRKHMTWFAFNK